MAVKSGAGAAVASGAAFQSRVAAFILISRICDYPLDFLNHRRVERLSFETAEAVDDLNVLLSGAEMAYIQAKATLDFSLVNESQLYSALRQFATQYLRTPDQECRYILAVGSESSRKIRQDLRSALDAYRCGDENSFRRDQPKALVEIINGVHGELMGILAGLGQNDVEFHARKLLYRSQVVPLELDEGTAFARIPPLLLQSKGFTAPDLVWGKLISDCLGHARHRRTVDVSDLVRSYERFSRPAEVTLAESWFNWQMEGAGFSVAKEVVLGFVETGGISGALEVGSVVLAELARFNDDCDERVRFRNGRCYIAAGKLVLRLLARSATYAGMMRLLEDAKEQLKGKKVYHFPMGSDSDAEHSLCATHHRKLLESAFNSNAEKMRCLHCSKPISNASCDSVETRILGKLRVGLVHPGCRRCEDRVIGIVQIPFFQEYPYLRNFDVKLWTSAMAGGQGVFGARQTLTPGVVVWNGEPKGVPGDWVIEYSLSNGDSAFIRKRGKVHRFSKLEGERECNEFARSWESSARLGDPFCLSERTATYGTRSFLLKHLRTPEKLLEIGNPRVTKFQQYMAERYQECKSWFAPLIFLRKPDDGCTFEIGGYIPLLTNPLDLAMYLENWGEARDIPDYEVIVLSTDQEFDDFAADAQRKALRLMVDPMVDPTGRPQFLSGIPIEYLDELVSRAQCDTKSV